MLDQITLLIIQIQVVTLSGALAPGPLTTAVVGSGLRSGWRAGFYAALGHLAVELPLILIIGLGVTSFLENITLQFILLISGSMALFYFGYLQIRYSKKPLDAGTSDRHPLLIGALFSLLNPYFIMWWLTIGGVLIFKWIDLLGYNISIIPFYVSHVWMDFAWLALISLLAGKGVEKLRWEYISILNIILGGILILFGLMFVYNAISLIRRGT